MERKLEGGGVWRVYMGRGAPRINSGSKLSEAEGQAGAFVGDCLVDFEVSVRGK